MKIKAHNLRTLLKQDPAPQQEVFILMGEDVWGFYRENRKDRKTDGSGQGWRLFADIVKAGNPNRYQDAPILIDENNLGKIASLEILPQRQQVVSIVDTDGFFGVKRSENGITIRHNQQILTDICLNLAKNTAVNTLTLRNNTGELLEDLSGHVSRIRNDDELAKLSATPEQIELDGEMMKKLAPNERAEYFYKWYNKPLAFHSQHKEIYIFNGKCWKILDETLLFRAIRDFHQEYGANYYSVDRIKAIRDCLAVDLPLFGETKNNLLAFNNGVLNKNTLEFLPHSQDYWLTGFNQCDYLQMETPTPNFDKWLDFISYGDEARKRSFLAGLYMILNNRNDWELTLELIGEAGGGKSVYLEIGKLLSGDGNHCAMELEILKDDKARDVILNKTFLYSSDQSKYVGDASIVKQISSGEEITFNPKNKKSFNQRVQAIIAICSNTLPIYRNDGGGMDRRRVIFPFNRAVDEKDRDINLKQNIKSELGGIIRKLYDTFPNANEAKLALFNQKTVKKPWK